jgi:hypothetical protein
MPVLRYGPAPDRRLWLPPGCLSLRGSSWLVDQDEGFDEAEGQRNRAGRQPASSGAGRAVRKLAVPVVGLAGAAARGPPRGRLSPRERPCTKSLALAAADLPGSWIAVPAPDRHRRPIRPTHAADSSGPATSGWLPRATPHVLPRPAPPPSSRRGGIRDQPQNRAACAAPLLREHHPGGWASTSGSSPSTSVTMIRASRFACTRISCRHRTSVPVRPWTGGWNALPRDSRSTDGAGTIGSVATKHQTTSLASSNAGRCAAGNPCGHGHFSSADVLPSNRRATISC